MHGSLRLLCFFLYLSLVCVGLEVEARFMRGSWPEDWSFLKAGAICAGVGVGAWFFTRKCD